MVDPRQAFKVGLTVLLSCFAAWVFASNILPTSRTLSATERRLERLEQRNRRTEDNIRAADREAERLSGDTWTVQRILRDEYRMSEHGEVIVR